MALDRVDDGGVSIWDRKIKFRNKVCNPIICRNAFNSGKAHVRNHSELTHDHAVKLKKQKQSEESEKHAFDFEEKKKAASAATMKESSCVICGKNFPSMKSLFGHMRCHPERDWRGIHPPSGTDHRMESTSIDLTQSLRGWAVTAKRGRKPIRAADLTSSEDDRLRDAVSFLLLLARGESADGGATQRVLMKKKKKKKKKKKRRKKVKLCDLNLMEEGGDKFRCNACDKSFSSYQGLGGHRSTHNKGDIILHQENKKVDNFHGKVVLDFDLNQLPSSC